MPDPATLVKVEPDLVSEDDDNQPQNHLNQQEETNYNQDEEYEEVSDSFNYSLVAYYFFRMSTRKMITRKRRRIITTSPRKESENGTRTMNRGNEKGFLLSRLNTLSIKIRWRRWKEEEEEYEEEEDEDWEPRPEDWRK